MVEGEEIKEVKEQTEQKEAPKTEEKKEPEKHEEKREEKREEKKEEKRVEKHEERPRTKFNGSAWYDRNYKKLLLIELILFVASIAYLGYFYSVHNDIMLKDTSLTGGTIVTIYNGSVSISDLTSYLTEKVGADFNIRTLEDTYSRKTIAVIVESKESPEQLKPVLETFLGYSLTTDNSGTEVTGSSLSQSFYRELLWAMVLAFVFMALVVFFIFKSLIPSLAVIQAALADIVFALTFANLFSFQISTAGIAALLMLIGYSVDTDILLTTRVLKRKGEGTVNSRIFSSIKTGLTMSLTSFCATLIGFFVAVAPTLKQIFFILAAGIFFDMFATWLGNASIVKWYCNRRKIT